MVSPFADYRESNSRQPGDLRETHGFAPRPRSRFALSEMLFLLAREATMPCEMLVEFARSIVLCEKLVVRSEAESICCY